MAWAGQVALVTGGARGIGRAIVRRLAQEGAAVCINYVAHADAAEALRAESLQEVRRPSASQPMSPTTLRWRRWPTASPPNSAPSRSW